MASDPPLAPAPDAQLVPALRAAADLLAARGLFGFAWLDGNLIVRQTFGRLADPIRVGLPVTAGLLALIGIEPEILALTAAADAPIVLPNVGIDPSDETASRMNIAIYRTTDALPYLVLVSQLLDTTTMERALNQEIRKSRLAEETIVAQAGEIARANTELTRANRDLEEFAYVISHDLQGPLRAMRAIGETVTEAATAHDLAGVTLGAAEIAAQSRRMSGMLTGLLSYAAVGRKSDVLEATETRDLAADIVRRLPRRPGFTVEIAGAWPRLVTLLVPLDVTLRNLVDNALKHHDRDAGHIRLAAETAGEFTLFTVSDDGPGIDPDWHEAIFLPFRKIDDNASPESSGIGLALVKKTVETLGGRIEVISPAQQRRGTAFRVFWPTVIAR